jgi:transcriptional regulator with XRE-family HTH domain
VAKELGQKIRGLRQDAGLSAAALAKRARLDPAALLRIERGENSNPSFTTVSRIAAALGVSLDSLKSAHPKASATVVGQIRQEEELRELRRLATELARRLERLSAE